MATAQIGTSASLHQDAHRRLGQALRAVHASIVEAGRRHQQRRALRVVRGLDHPGVLADMEAASYQAWDPRTPPD